MSPAIIANPIPIVLLARIAASIIAILVIGCDKHPPADKYSHIPSEKEETIAEAHAAVLKHLKYPDDSEFLDADEIIPDERKPRYFSVHGKVKAANTFGAKLTHRFVVHVRRSEHGKWSTHHVQLGDDVVFSDPWPKP